MSKRAGRNGRIYVAIASGGTATPLVNMTKWTLSGTSDRFDGTSFGDANKTYVAGLPDASGTYDGFLDSAAQDTWTASQDGVARKFYLYPDVSNDPGDYWFGTAFFDFSTEVMVNGISTAKGTWSAATSVIRVDA